MDSVPVFKQLIQLFNWVLVNLHDLFSAWGLSEDWTWGFAIIGLTIIVRLILFPLTWKQYSNAQALQAMQPRVKELQRKHKDDRNKLQAETMKLYQEHRVNPFASCLPLLLQLPVFIALYYAIRGTDYLDPTTTKALADAGFLWIKSVAAGGAGLGQPDPTHVLLVLYVVTQLISTELMLATQSDKMQKWLMRLMPIMFVFFLWSFPAGLFVYWVTTNLWTIGQQLLIRKAMKPYTPSADNGKPVKRSRIVDALVTAQDKGDKGPASTSGATQKKGPATQRTAQAASKSGSGQGAKTAGGGKQTSGAKGGGARPAGSKRVGAKPAARAKPGSGPKTAGDSKASANPKAGASGSSARSSEAKPDHTSPAASSSEEPAANSRPAPAVPPSEGDTAERETKENGPAES